MIPEAPYDLDRLAAILPGPTAANPRRYALVITAEGAIWQGAQDAGRRRRRRVRPPPQGERRRGAGGRAKRRTGIEAVASELTYDLRSASPTSLDAMVATTFANVAMDLLRDGDHGPDGRDPGRQVRPRGAAAPEAGAPRRRRRRVQRGAVPPAVRGRLGEPMLLRGWLGARAGGLRPRSTLSRRGPLRERIARARCDMSSSP